MPKPVKKKYGTPPPAATRSVQLVTLFREEAMKLKARWRSTNAKVYRHTLKVEGILTKIWTVVSDDDDDIPF